MKKLLFVIDIFPIVPKFYISKNKNLPSTIGGILTIINFIIYFIFLFTTFTEFFKRQNFTNLYTRDTMQYFQYNQSETPFFISFFDSNANQIPFQNFNKYLKIYGDYYEFDPLKQINITRTTFPLENCNLSSVLNEYSISINSTLGVVSQCIPRSQNNLMILGGAGDIRGFSYLSFNFIKCYNTTENGNSCPDLNAINNFIRNSILMIGTVDYDINHQITDYPFVPKFISKAFSLNPNNFKSISIKRKKVTYTSDSGYFSKLYSYFENDLFDSIEVNVQNLDTNEKLANVFIEISLETSGAKEINYRKYQRVQEAFAGVFTIIAGLNALSQIFIEFIHEKIYFQKLINKILNLDQSFNDYNFKKIAELKKSLVERNNNKFNGNLHKKEFYKRDFKKVYM